MRDFCPCLRPDIGRGYFQEHIASRQAIASKRSKNHPVKLKVQAQIMEEQVRVSGKDRDELQAVIALLKAADFPLPLQFTNYRS